MGDTCFTVCVKVRRQLFRTQFSPSTTSPGGPSSWVFRLWQAPFPYKPSHWLFLSFKDNQQRFPLQKEISDSLMKSENAALWAIIMWPEILWQIPESWCDSGNVKPPSSGFVLNEAITSSFDVEFCSTWVTREERMDEAEERGDEAFVLEKSRTDGNLT